MSAKAIREFHGKHLLAYHLSRAPLPEAANLAGHFDAASSPVAAPRLAHIAIELPAPTAAPATASSAQAGADASQALHAIADPNKPFASDAERIAAVTRALDAAEASHPWLKAEKLVVKPDMLIKRRGKAGLLGINLDWAQARKWVLERAAVPIK
ncbi:hypothetical protein BC828DRAFT_403077, partial [Blastocladiella britannica]